jgi:hypothetical protein
VWIDRGDVKNNATFFFKKIGAKYEAIGAERNHCYAVVGHSVPS